MNVYAKLQYIVITEMLLKGRILRIEMPSCLGMYIDKNVIKYAKISKEHDTFKVEAYGIKFYEDIEEAAKQIVNETYSYKVPICTNLSDESYMYADMFSLLNKKYIQKAIDTEFEMFCNDNGKNKSAIKYKAIQVPNLEDKDKITTIYSYVNKASIVSRLQELAGLNVSGIIPLSLANPLLNKFAAGEDSIYIDIEDKTTITTVISGNVYRVDTIDNGMEEILNVIAAKENSTSKAYEICKNATIYTMAATALQVTENEYMEDIMPTLYSIIEETKEIIAKNQISVSNIYITGLATAISNLDLYFQENFIDKKCEILRPFFAEKMDIKVNIKDYIEVNAAIALALNNLTPERNNINFKNETLMNKISSKVTIGSKGENGANKEKRKEKKQSTNKSLENFIKMDLGVALDNIEKAMLRVTIGLLILIIFYSTLSRVITNQINSKGQETQKVIAYTEDNLKEIEQITSSINTKITDYKTMINKIDEANAELSEHYSSKNSIPNLLNNIQYAIPSDVQMLSIQNTTGKHIQMKVEAEEYQQLGIFIANLKVDSILTNITCDAGTRTNNLIQITIEGDLPY